MPRRRSRRSRRTNGSSFRGGISSITLHSLTTSTLSGVTGTATISVTPQNFGGVTETADQFDLFRFKRLRYRIHPMDPADTTNQVVCYYPDVDIQTQTSAQAAESPLAACQTPFCGVPSRWINVPPSQLKGMLDWYKCVADAGAAEFESQGIIQLVGGLSDVLRAEIEAVILFKNPVSSELQMQRAVDRAVRKGLVVRVNSTPSGPEDPSAVKNAESSQKRFPPCVCGRIGRCCLFVEDINTTASGDARSAVLATPLRRDA